jgi:hypothetical protein
MMASKVITGLAMAIVSMNFAISSSFAGQIEANADGVTVWQAGIDGPRIEWAPDGSFSRLYSRYSQPVAFPDRQGIIKAQIIAEEKAKAAIIRFLDQQVVTGQLITEVTNDMNQSTRTKGTEEGDRLTKTSQRQMIENLTEVTASASSGRLHGVIVLERGYDDKDEVAWVEVGISKKTIGTARSLGDAINNEPGKSGAASAQSGSQKGINSLQMPGSEVQRSPQKDW